MKKKENLLILMSILCGITLVPFGVFGKDFSLKIWYLTRIWMILFVAGLIKVFLAKWQCKYRKCKIFIQKKRKYLLIILAVELAVMGAFKIYNIKKERVQALKRNQAVMAMVKYSHAGESGFYTELCVINKAGRWKCIDVYDPCYEELAGGEWKESELTVETLDKILASTKIPYDLGKVLFTRKELNEAIRKKDVSYYNKFKEVYERPWGMYACKYIYYNVQGGKKRDVYLVGEKKTSEQWKDGKEVAALDATYKKWIRAMEVTSYDGQELPGIRDEEKKQIWLGFVFVTVAMIGLVLILGVFDGYMLRGWWQRPHWGFQKNNLSFILWLILIQLVFHIRIIVENAIIIFNVQFFLLYCFTMGVWCFWEMGNWRRYCGIMKDEGKYKGLYLKGKIFLTTMGCCWFGAIIDFFVRGIP